MTYSRPALAENYASSLRLLCILLVDEVLRGEQVRAVATRDTILPTRLSLSSASALPCWVVYDVTRY